MPLQETNQFCAFGSFTDEMTWFSFQGASPLVHALNPTTILNLLLLSSFVLDGWCGKGWTKSESRTVWQLNNKHAALDKSSHRSTYQAPIPKDLEAHTHQNTLASPSLYKSFFVMN